MTGERPTSVISELAFPVCFHAEGSALPVLSDPTTEKINVIVCTVDGCVQPRHSMLAPAAASTAAPSSSRGLLACGKMAASATLPSGRTPTRTLTFVTIADSAIGG